MRSKGDSDDNALAETIHGLSGEGDPSAIEREASRGGRTSDASMGLVVQPPPRVLEPVGDVLPAEAGAPYHGRQRAPQAIPA